MELDLHAELLHAAHQGPLLLHPVVLLRGQERPAQAAGFGGQDGLVADRLGHFRAESYESPDREEILKGGDERAESARGETADDHPARVRGILFLDPLVGGFKILPGYGDVLPVEPIHIGDLGRLDIDRDELPAKPRRRPGGLEFGGRLAAAVQGDEEGVLFSGIIRRRQHGLDVHDSFFLGFCDTGPVLFQEGLEARGVFDRVPALGDEVPEPVKNSPAVAFLQGLDRLVGVAPKKARQGQVLGIDQNVVGKPVQDAFQEGGRFIVLFLFEELSEIFPHLLVAPELAFLLALEQSQGQRTENDSQDDERFIHGDLGPPDRTGRSAPRTMTALFATGHRALALIARFMPG